MKKERKKRLRLLAERRREREKRRSREEIAGILKMTQSGFGFVAPEEGGEIFIPARMVNGALDGDRVRVELLPPRPDFRGEAGHDRAGRITEVLERGRREYVGELLPGNRIRPLNGRLPDEIVLDGPRRGAARGDWVKFRLDERDGDVWHGAILHGIGRADVIASDLDAVMEEYHLPKRYTTEEDDAARALAPREIVRADRTSLPAVTIDPADAKDFDDALSLVPNPDPGKVTIGVHISDVAAYIAPQSRFDQAAARRAFSCYLPGRTLPMLPPKLTAQISLAEHQKSLAHTVFLDVDRTTGEIVGSRREHSLVEVAFRLDYPAVQKFFDGKGAPGSWTQELRAMLKTLLDVTRKMRAFRAEKESFIELPLPEIRVLCTETDNKILGLDRKLSAESEQLVEECMLGANSVVGKELVERAIPGLFRVHPAPEAEKTMEFADLMADSFHLKCGDVSNRAVCNAFIASLPDDPRREVILSALLRSLPRAYYDAKASIHFALGKTRYCHFTSPIRRYTDLVVHQQLWNFDSKMRLRAGRTLEKLAAVCSEAEENNDAAYYAACDRLKLRYLEERLESGDDNLYESVIARVLSGGLQIDVPALGVYGFVPVEQLGGRFDRMNGALHQQYGKRSYKCGDYLYVRLARIDFARGSAVFVPAGR